MGKLQPGVNDLYTWCSNNGDWGKRLIKEWAGFDENNQPISMNGIARASTKKVKWKCLKGHEWYAGIGSRTHNRTGCPYCHKQSKKGAQPGKVSLLDWCLTHGEHGKQLMDEWTPRVNGKPSGMDLISYGSQTEATWRCKNGHTWKAVIAYRTISRTNCPYCSGRLASKANNLYDWCIHNGDFGQQLIREWAGVDENNQPISMDSVSYGSDKKVKWKCLKGHEWYTNVTYRTDSKTGCPYCSGHRVTERNSLMAWCLKNGEFGQRLIKEWTGFDENNQPISMDSVTRATTKKVKWKCSKGHEWYTDIGSRTDKKIGCPYCSGHRVTEQNSLKAWCSNNGDFGQQLISEWTGQDENNQPISMDGVSYGSKKKVKWKCSQGHEWYARINNRTSNTQGCPYCEKLNRSKKQHK